jgi:hypothetical protein
MSLFKKMFRDKPPASVYSSRDASPLDSTDDSGPASRGNSRREVVHVVLRETMRQHGIPSDWIECRTLSMVSANKTTGTYVTLIVRDGHDRLLPYVPAFQASFRKALERFDPRVGDWLKGLAWQFEDGEATAPAAMPAAGSWFAPSTGLEVKELDAAGDEDLQSDLQALFAIRDAALSEAKERGAPLDFQQTQRGL